MLRQCPIHDAFMSLATPAQVMGNGFKIGDDALDDVSAVELALFRGFATNSVVNCSFCKFRWNQSFASQQVQVSWLHSVQQICPS